jgi:tetratricopeptide (TPR) repeat protein
VAEQNTPRPFVIRDWKYLTAGELALAENRHGDAINLLSESVPNVRFRSKRHYLFGAHSLARAYAATGQVEDAIATLEQARREKQWSIIEFAATYLWFRSQLYLMELYGQTGRSENADDIADELREMLVMADADYPIRTRLDNQSANNGD